MQLANQELNITVEQNFISSTEDRPFNDERYRLDWSKVTALGWQPKVEFTDGLREILLWHNSNNLRRDHWNDSQWLSLVQKK